MNFYDEYIAPSKDVIRKRLQSRELNCMARYEYRKTALHLACDKGLYDVVVLLLECPNIQVNVRDNCGKTPLHAASSQNYHQLVLLLLQYKDIDVNAKDRCGITPLMDACMYSQMEAVCALLTHPKININCQDEGDNTAFFYACQNGHLGIVQKLLNQKKLKANIPNLDGITPFADACRQGWKKLVKWLIKHPKIDVTQYSKAGSTPLHFASNQGHLNVAKILLKDGKININAKGVGGLTPFHMCCTTGQLNLVEFFLSQKDLDYDARDNMGRTPFYLACCYHHFEVVKVLSKYCNMEIPNELGQTPFSRLVKSGAIDMVNFLIKKNVNIMTKDQDGNTPILLACSLYNYQIMELLFKRIPPIDPAWEFALFVICRETQFIEFTMPGYYDPEESAIARKRKEELCLRAINILLAKGVRADQPVKGITPIVAACRNENSVLIQRLIINGQVPPLKAVYSNVVTKLLDDYWRDPPAFKIKAMKNLGILNKNRVIVYYIIQKLIMGYYKIKTILNNESRFFNLVIQLPNELIMTVINRAHYFRENIIPLETIKKYWPKKNNYI